MDFAYFGTTFVSILVILDPPGALPVFLGLTAGYTTRERHAVARKASVTAFGVLLTFAVVGRQIVEYLHISIPALQVAGGLLLLIIGLELVRGHDGTSNDDGTTNIALVPLAVPIFAGPGVIVAIMLAMQRSTGWPQILAVLLALVAAMLVVWLSMHYAGLVHRVLRDSGTTLVSRIAGLLCSAIAVQMLADGVIGFVRTI